MLIIPQQLKIYSKILALTREVEQEVEKKSMIQIQNKATKRPFPQMNRGNPVRPIGAPLTKRPLQYPP